MSEQFYNPSAAYLAGRTVRAAVTEARQTIAQLIGAKMTDIIFTAGATESINLALQGVLRAYPTGELVTLPTEHEAILQIAKAHTAHLAPVDHHGVVVLEDIQRAITDRTVLVSIAYVNNELGTVQDVRGIARMIAAIRQQRRQTGNDLPLFLHSDASQAAGHLDLHVARLGVDLMTLNAAKVYGPKQVGLLYVQPSVRLDPLIYGGGQERHLRGGTENVAGIIGFARALQLAEETRHDTTQHFQNLRRSLITALTAADLGVVVNSLSKRFSPHILSLSFPRVDGERLLMQLDQRGIMVATGSACAANRDTTSHVLTAIGLSDELIAGSLRLSFGRDTSLEQVEYVAEQIIDLVRTQTGKTS